MLTGKMSFEDAIILDVEICSNGIMGGDGGHGGFCSIQLKSTEPFEIKRENNYELGLYFTGDAERRTLRDAFRYMAEYLDQELGISDDGMYQLAKRNVVVTNANELFNHVTVFEHQKTVIQVLQELEQKVKKDEMFKNETIIINSNDGFFYVFELDYIKHENNYSLTVYYEFIGIKD